MTGGDVSFSQGRSSTDAAPANVGGTAAEGAGQGGDSHADAAGRDSSKSLVRVQSALSMDGGVRMSGARRRASVPPSGTSEHLSATAFDGLEAANHRLNASLLAIEGRAVATLPGAGQAGISRQWVTMELQVKGREAVG